MARELKVVGYLNGVKLEGPLPEDVCRIMMQNLSKTMSAYYTQHPDEYAALCRATPGEGESA